MEKISSNEKITKTILNLFDSLGYSEKVDVLEKISSSLLYQESIVCCDKKKDPQTPCCKDINSSLSDHNCNCTLPINVKYSYRP